MVTTLGMKKPIKTVNIPPLKKVPLFKGTTLHFCQVCKTGYRGWKQAARCAQTPVLSLIRKGDTVQAFIGDKWVTVKVHDLIVRGPEHTIFGYLVLLGRWKRYVPKIK